jgi:hypothetical protein
MFDQIIQFAKEQLGDQVKSEHGLSDTEHKEVFDVAHSSVLDSIKGQIGSGNISGIMDMFNGNGDTDHNTNALAGGMHSNVIQGLMDKFGFDSAKAGGIANSIVPSIIKRFSSPETGNASDPADLVKKIGMDSDNGIMDMISKFTGGGGGGIGDMVKGLFDGK